MTWTIAALMAVAIAVPAGSSQVAGINDQIPAGYEIISQRHLAIAKPARSFEIVATARKGEDKSFQQPERAPARPLLLFEHIGHRLVLVGRNDHAVLRADEGGQCDPFLDGDARIAAKGRFFTIENGVACGQHWTDFITFRFDDRLGGFVFDNERQEDWILNPSTSPDAEALVRAGPPRLLRDQPGQVTAFANWRPKRR